MFKSSHLGLCPLTVRSFPFHLSFFHFYAVHTNPGPCYSCWTQSQSPLTNLPGQVPPPIYSIYSKCSSSLIFHCSFPGLREAFCSRSCSRAQTGLLRPASRPPWIWCHRLSNLTSYFTFPDTLPSDRHSPSSPSTARLSPTSIFDSALLPRRSVSLPPCI